MADQQEIKLILNAIVKRLDDVKTLAAELDKTGVAADVAQENLSEASDKTERFGVTGGKIGGILSGITGQLAVLGTAISGAFSIKEAADFEVALDKLRARADETGPALDALIQKAAETAQTLGPQFGKSATEAVGGLTQLVAAGFSAKEAIDALPGVLSLSAIEGTNLEQSVTLVSDAIVQFGLRAADASKVSDILVSAAGAVAASATDIGESLKYAGTAANQAGLSLTETSAILDVLAQSGQRGSEAGTGLASVLNVLSNPAHAATKALFDMGATSTNLSDVLGFLKERGLNASEAIALFGEQGSRVINTLLAQGGSDAIDDFGNKIANSGKTAEQTAKIMQENLLGAFDRFWESLKRVGIELGTPKLESYASGLDKATAILNEFASNENIKAFQQDLANGFNSIYIAARDFANGVDWDGISVIAGETFVKIKDSIGIAIEAIGTIISSLTGSLPGAAGIAKESGDAIKAAWTGLGETFLLVAEGIQKIADTFAGDVPAGTQKAQLAIQELNGSTNEARKTYDTLLVAFTKGIVTQQNVADSFENLENVTIQVNKSIDNATDAYNATVAAQKDGAATQEQVEEAWKRLQETVDVSNKKIESAKLAHESLSKALESGKVATESVANAYGDLNKRIDENRQASDEIINSVERQKTGFSELWDALKSNAPDAVQKTWDALTTSAANLLGAIKNIAQFGAEALAGFIRDIDLTPVLDLFVQVTASIKSAETGITSSLQGIGNVGETIANSLTIAFGGISGIVAAVASGIIAVSTELLKAKLSVDEFFGSLSAEEISRIEQNITGLEISSQNFAKVSADSFAAAGAAMNRLNETSDETAARLKSLREEQDKSAEAAKAAAAAAKVQENASVAVQQKVINLTDSIKKQQEEVNKLTESNKLGTDSQEKLSNAGATLAALQTDLKTSVAALTDEQRNNVLANEDAKTTIEGLNNAVKSGTGAYTEYKAKVAEVPPTLEQLRETMLRTAAELKHVNDLNQQGLLIATDTKSSVEQLNEARVKASDGLQVYLAALERNITAEENSAKTAESSRKALEATTQVQIAVTDATLKLAEARGDENAAAAAVAEKNQQIVDSSKQIQIELEKEAIASQKIADALKLKYDALVETNPLDKVAIQNAKDAAQAAESEAIAKKAAADEAAASIPILQREAEVSSQLAGPLGELIRLYEKRTESVKLEKDAIDRNYDAQIRELETIKSIAESKGNLAEASKAAADAAALETEKAQAIADATAAESKTQIDLIEAKKLLVLASDKTIEAKNREITILDDAIAKYEDEAKSAQDTADTVAAANEKITSSLYEQETAARNAKVGIDEWKGSMKDVNLAFAQIGERGAAAFDVTGIRIYQSAVEEIDRKLSRVSPLLTEIKDAMAGASTAVGALSLQRLLSESTELASSLDTVRGYMQETARTAAEDLLKAVAEAKIQMQEFATAQKEALKDRLEAIEDYRVQNNQLQQEELRYQREIIALNEQLNIARSQGNIAAVDYILKQIDAETELHELKMRDLREQQRAQEEVNRAATDTRAVSVLQQNVQSLADLSKNLKPANDELRTMLQLLVQLELQAGKTSAAMRKYLEELLRQIQNDSLAR